MSDTFRLRQAKLPKKVIFGECWARDGLQNELQMVPTDAKVEMITRMVEAGMTRLEATSFAHPKYLPQFADSEEVLRRIPRKKGVQYRGLCTTMKLTCLAVSLCILASLLFQSHSAAMLLIHHGVSYE